MLNKGTNNTRIKMISLEKDMNLVKWFYGKKLAIPNSWRISSLGEETSQIQDMDHKMPKKLKKGIPFLSIGQIVNNEQIDFSDPEYISEEDYQKFLKKIEPKKGDLLYSRVATIGEARIISDDRKFAFTYNVVLIKTSSTLDSKFLLYCLNSSLIKNHAKSLAPTGAYSFLGLGDIRKIPIIVPTVEEQRKIAIIISNVDNLIDSYDKKIIYTKCLKQSLIQQLLTKGIGHKKFKKVKWYFGKEIEIPEEWSIVLLDHVATRGSGHTPNVKISEYYNGGIKWISLADSKKLDNVFISETEKEISQEGINNSSAIIHPIGTVVLSRDAGIGKSAITTQKMAVSQHFIVWQCGDKLDNYFLYYLLQLWKPLFENIAIGTTIKTIGLSFFKKLRIPLPSNKEQKIISSILLNSDKELWDLVSKKTQLEILKKGLMQKLLTGEIRVSV